MGTYSGIYKSHGPLVKALPSWGRLGWSQWMRVWKGPGNWIRAWGHKCYSSGVVRSGWVTTDLCPHGAPLLRFSPKHGPHNGPEVSRLLSSHAELIISYYLLGHLRPRAPVSWRVSYLNFTHDHEASCFVCCFGPHLGVGLLWLRLFSSHTHWC